ncbi:glycosyltransferase family 33 protein [Suhomyces tanzawaensis NRRL Y-17324]|uniref:Chitobiosyldiphosphodolichol beta-mannosyltransferase n=1 Tax=Suhomyces tanzawaensis NRRL Y-17324 TaxID=984487 RepID=A0A1E4SEJ4_9ASCO|nr:glycosyltransferase family 33 protein [Suhomyces tanzawaensis NRRL Y-17324]ODV77812.1 glycosyltransferase family 33 protein [Suhomyces tanzawaensis NRRL Y-17324]
MVNIDHIIKYKGFDHLFYYTGPWVWWLLGIYLCLPVIAYKILPYFNTKGTYTGKKRTISIFVLGDIGHSPRMCYHARSFSKLDYYVNLSGYVETQPPVDLLDDPNVEIHDIEPIKNNSDLPYLLFALQKLLLQLYQLFQLCLDFRGSDFIMIQNPPSIPILLVAIIVIKIFSKNTKLIIDWHNLNYTIMNLRYRNLSHPVVKLIKFYEKFLGRFADVNITVTAQMKQFLVEEFGFKRSTILTLHDRPAEQFEPFENLNITKEEVFRNHEIFGGIDNIRDYKILVTATSFTPDEDFNILLDALVKYDSDVALKLPPILLIVTGKGPLKQQFLAKAQNLGFTKNIVIRSGWLSSEDYPIILSMADLAVSLHTSSSGIDLPMKIVDFFGCGVPVVSLNFPAIGELVKDGINGLVTGDNEKSLDQAGEIYRLISKAFTNQDLLRTLKEGALVESKRRWDDNWKEVMGQRFEYESS